MRCVNSCSSTSEAYIVRVRAVLLSHLIVQNLGDCEQQKTNFLGDQRRTLFRYGDEAAQPPSHP